MKPRIAIDLDGVGADFHKFVRNLYGGTYPEIGAERFWKKADQVDNLFLNLDPIPGSKVLYDFAYSYRDTHEVFVLTALPLLTGKLHTAEQDKKDWVKKHIGDIPVVCSNGWKDKRNWCRGKHDILIDDMHRNIEDWNDAGGTAIHHTDISTTINMLEYLLSK